MNDAPFVLYSFQNKKYYESVDDYKPDDIYKNTVKSYLIESDWEITEGGFWTLCTPRDYLWIEAGWKIHVSSVPQHAIKTLSVVSKILSNKHAAFKYCSDVRMLKMSLSKSWPRVQVGKFITIYPKSLSSFKEIIEDLYLETDGLSGPYILTDKCYKDSETVFYRYGAHVGRYKATSHGRLVAGYLNNQGEWTDDIRGPAFYLPDGITDPFAGDTKAMIIKNNKTSSRQVTFNDRYRIEGAMKFNANGGVYYGTDMRSGSPVILREIRGMLGYVDEDVTSTPLLLARQKNILSKLAPTGLTPKFVDLFKKWNNWFLVEERLNASTLWNKAMDFYFNEDDAGKSNASLEKIISCAIKIGEGVEKIHSYGIVLRDLTRTNVMFTESNELRFVDFEFAFDISENSGKWLKGWTPGYASREQIDDEMPSFLDDYYAYGALILDMLTFSASGLEFNRDAAFRKLELVISDFQFPCEIIEIVRGLTSENKYERLSISEAIDRLKSLKKPNGTASLFRTLSSLISGNEYGSNMDQVLSRIETGIVSHLKASADYARKDRLWPSSPQQMMTNPVSIQYGAAGTAWFLLNSDGAVDAKVLDWINDRAIGSICPPGLYIGLAGVSAFLLHAGRIEQAEFFLKEAENDRLIREQANLYFGLSGLGLLYLHFWFITHNDKYLECAKKIGIELTRCQEKSDVGCFWRSGADVNIGLGDGQSGVALFFIYLAAATNDSAFTSMAKLALDFDIAQCKTVSGMRFWRLTTNEKVAEPYMPHMRFGSAGIGSVCLRFFCLTGDAYYRDVALECAHTNRIRWSNKIWQEIGNAGFGEFMLDISDLLGDERYRKVAYYHAGAIIPCSIITEHGIAFAGVDHYRLCSDYSHGGAGIGLFINRLLKRRGRMLFLDDILPSRKASLES